jgi:hypothetical protein
MEVLTDFGYISPKCPGCGSYSVVAQIVVHISAFTDWKMKVGNARFGENEFWLNTNFWSPKVSEFFLKWVNGKIQVHTDVLARCDFVMCKFQAKIH